MPGRLRAHVLCLAVPRDEKIFFYVNLNCFFWLAIQEFIKYSEIMLTRLLWSAGTNIAAQQCLP